MPGHLQPAARRQPGRFQQEFPPENQRPADGGLPLQFDQNSGFAAQPHQQQDLHQTGL